MVSFEFKGEQYKTPDGWKDVTFGKFLDYLSEVATEVPEELKALYSHEDTIAYWNDIPAKEKRVIYDFFALSVGFWCGLDVDDIKNHLNLEQLEQAFFAIEHDLNIEQEKEDEDFCGFDIDGKEWLLPKRHMIGSTVAEFSEAAQFEENVNELEGGSWAAMQDVMVVLCRPKNEPYSYDEKRHNIRKKMFKKLTMDKIIQVAFFLHRRNKELNHNLLIYSLMDQVEEKEQKQLEKHTDGLY